MVLDLSKEVLNIDFGQGAAKISEGKVGGSKKKLLTRHDSTPMNQQIFFRPPTLTSDIFAAS